MVYYLHLAKIYGKCRCIYIYIPCMDPMGIWSNAFVDLHGPILRFNVSVPGHPLGSRWELLPLLPSSRLPTEIPGLNLDDPEVLNSIIPYLDVHRS